MCVSCKKQVPIYCYVTKRLFSRLNIKFYNMSFFYSYIFSSLGHSYELSRIVLETLPKVNIIPFYVGEFWSYSEVTKLTSYNKKM